jgi:hypothetical protein
MVYSVLSEARVQGSLADQQPTERSYSIYWLENGNLEGWTTFVDLDVVGSWGGYLFGTKRTPSGGFIGPSSTFTPVDAAVNDRIFFRLKYDKHPNNTASTSFGKIRWTTVSDPVFDDLKSATFDLFSDGSWHFYEVNVGDVSTWVGEINKVQFFPCEDGARNDEFFLNFFEIGTNEFTFSFDNPKAGKPGKLTGGLALVEEITIEKDVNDKLIVNIDGYGNVQSTLTPQTAAPETIARDMAFQLGKVSIGGYLRVNVYIDDQTQKLVIESGIRADDSSVQVVYGSQSAAVVLGLTNAAGDFIGTTEPGEDPDSNFVPLSTYRPTTLEILAMFDNDDDLPALTLDPQKPVIEGGRSDYATINRKLKTTIVTTDGGSGLQGTKIESAGEFDFEGKTLIDLNHPFTDDGQLSRIFANGVFDPNGASKWKIFRPSLGGDLTLVSEGEIGKKTIVDDPNGGLVTSPNPDTVSVDVSTANVTVRAGDLLGIYNASLHAGQTGTSKIDAMYYVISGDATGTITPPTPSGAGEAGLAIYAVGAATKSKAVIDIDLNRRLNLDTIKVTGEEDARDLEYNIAIASSATFSADTPGAHTVCYDLSPILRVCFERNNAAFNLPALNDGITIADNGITGFGDGGAGGLGGATVANATYFYVNGDSEFFNVYEFVGQDPESYEFARDPIGIDCFFSSTTPRLDKPIGKAVIYFKEKRNQRVWQIEYSVGNKGGNGSKQGFSLIPANTVDRVKIDEKEIVSLGGRFVTSKVKSDLSEILLTNPVELDVIAQDGTRNPQAGIDFVDDVGELGGINFREQVTFLEMQWNRFEWNFESIRTDGFRWFCDFHFSTKIAEFEVYAVSESNEAIGDNVQILFSADGERFTTAEIITANEKEATYKLGNSPQYLRMIVRPTLTTSVNDIRVDFEEDQICLGEEGRLEGSLPITDARIGKTGEATPLLITNDMGQTADLLLDIPSDTTTARQLLYFSKLHSETDILKPQVGPPGQVDFDSDKILRETENVAINAKAYGLLSLASGTEDTFTDDLLVNGGFESGDLTGWNLNVTASGSEFFQIPQVLDISEGSDAESTKPGLQVGGYVFGFEMDNEIAITKDRFTPVAFTLDQTINISEFAEDVDTGLVNTTLALRHRTYYIPDSNNPVVRFIGAPTLSGVNESPGTVIAGYGSNLLRSNTLFQSDSVTSEKNSVVGDIQATVASGTRFLKLRFDVGANNPRTSSLIKRMKFLLDSVELKLKIPELVGARWYKAWRNSIGNVSEFEGFTDASFVDVPATDFVTTTGSYHWWQPFDSSATGGVPVGGQTQGFSNAFLQDRTKGIQSFARMIPAANPGILGAQWEGEREIAGLRIAFSHNPTTLLTAQQYPRHFHLEVLKTRSELGGVAPDINNPAHAWVVRAYQEQGPFAPSNDLTGVTEGPDSIVTTWLFEDGPVSTEGIKIIFTRNCDRFEAAVFETGVGAPYLTGAEFTAFTNETTCPDNFFSGTGFSSNLGIGVSYFVPLEAKNITSLPLDNVREHNESNTNIFAAVDLGRVYDIDTQAALFELIATTASQSEWNAATSVFSDTDTNDPNLVQWAGGSNKARWVRFSCPAETDYEPADQLVDASNISTTAARVSSIPQSTLTQARIYPRIQTTLFPTIGYNSTWEDLGDILTDNRNDTFIYYSDYPVIALDLGKRYLINNDATAFRNNHDFITGVASSLSDQLYWDQNSEDDFAYAATPSEGSADPEKIPFAAYGAGVPDFGVRWVAFKGTDALQVPGDTGPKDFNFQTGGQVLFGATFRPRDEEVLTENANWFTTEKAVLTDISTIAFTTGIPVSVQDGVDFGSSHDNLGPALNAFDGRFTEFDVDIWGVTLREPTSAAQIGDTLTFLENPDFDFPHSIWRVFRDPYRGEVLTKEVKSIAIFGYNEDFYPKTFKFQSLRGGKDPTLNSSWLDIQGASFTGIDTFQGGLGFTHIFPEPISTTGIRVYITDSEYPDDEATTQLSDTGTETFSTVQNISGPQTRVASIIIYEEEIEEATIVGTIDNNHARGASFSSLTSTPGHAADLLGDGNINTYWQSTGFTDTITMVLPRKTVIDRFEWEQGTQFGKQTDGLSTGAPEDFTLQATVGGILTNVLNETAVSGTSYVGVIDPPVYSDTFTFDITRVQGQHEAASSIIVSELRLIEEVVQVTPLVTFEEVVDRRPASPNVKSTKATYAADSDTLVPILLTGIDAGNDELWSQRDFFTFWLKINDISLFDTTIGTIKLGNDAETFYSWNIADLNLTTGWNHIRLQFRSATDITEIPFQTAQFDPNTGESQVDFLTSDIEITSAVDGNFSQRVQQAPGIRHFEFEFRGTKGSRELELTFDDMRFERNKFDDTVKFAPSLYLNNSEFMSINLNGIDLASGTVEFWMQPDWSVSGKLRGDQSVLPALFRMIRPDGKFFNLFYRPNTGFIVAVFDGEQLLNFVSNVELYPFQPFDVFHFAVTWDANRRIPPFNASLVMYFNGEPVYGADKSWKAVRESGNRIGFGGELSQRFAASPHNAVAQVFTPIPTLPAKVTASSWAAIENLKIYNYPKTDFSDRFEEDLVRTQLVTPSEMIEISLDNVNFEGVGSANLPLVRQDVAHDESVTLYVRTNIPKGLTGDENRDASVIVRWKTPLQECELG